MKIIETRAMPVKFKDLYIGDVFATELTEEYQNKSIYMKISSADTNSTTTAVCLSEPGGGTLEMISANTTVYPYPDATLVLNKILEE